MTSRSPALVTLVMRHGQIVHFEAVGSADIAEKRPMTRDCLFAIASMTKPITATAMLILQDEGKLSVDDPVSKFIPQFKDARIGDRPLAREITIHDLMTHTAGLGSPAAKEALANDLFAQTAEQIAAVPLQFEPGSKWKYSDEESPSAAQSSRRCRANRTTNFFASESSARWE